MSVSLDEQLARFEERDRNPLKRFKVDPRGLDQPRKLGRLPARGARNAGAHRHAARAVDGGAGGRQASGAAGRAARAVRPGASKVLE